MFSKIEVIQKKLFSKGFDITRVFNSSWYNDIKPKQELIDFRKDSVGLLIGNSKKLWPEFKIWLKEDPARVFQSNPFDSFVVEVLESILKNETFDIYFSFETSPDRLVAFQRLADVIGIASLVESCHLCVHEKFGPWFALRAAVIFHEQCYIENPSRFNITLDHEEEIQVKSTLDRALIATETKDPEAWKHWVSVRDCISIGKEFRYSEEQILYHYTKSVAILEKVIIE